MSDQKTAAEACRAALGSRGLDIVSVEYGDMWDTTREMEIWGLRPRDALNLAIMKRAGEKSIVTEDERFDKAGVKRIPIDVFARSI